MNYKCLKCGKILTALEKWGHRAGWDKKTEGPCSKALTSPSSSYFDNPSSLWNRGHQWVLVIDEKDFGPVQKVINEKVKNLSNQELFDAAFILAEQSTEYEEPKEIFEYRMCLEELSIRLKDFLEK